ncbi:unannotated protein [freshwater metagenome]|jgi:hypothetical protein|uniref:Unannotated protein n=1 Tax=freshwater metagenome TaxID=449393 RepID=A0A6J6D2S9_9ZZZZ
MVDSLWTVANGSRIILTYSSADHIRRSAGRTGWLRKTVFLTSGPHGL